MRSSECCWHRGASSAFYSGGKLSNESLLSTARVLAITAIGFGVFLASRYGTAFSSMAKPRSRFSATRNGRVPRAPAADNSRSVGNLKYDVPLDASRMLSEYETEVEMHQD